MNYCNNKISEFKISNDTYDKKLQGNINLYNEMINDLDKKNYKILLME